MAIGVLILGESGSGKSYSMRNLAEDEAKVISVEKPILPFKNHLELVRTNDVDKIIKEMKSTEKKIIVIDDFQYILGLAAMRRSLEKGWDKFSEMQYDYFKILDTLKELPEDMIVYFMSHTETTDDGVTKIKTIGKALDKYITIEGLFMIVLGTRVSDGQYYFITQTNGKDTLKTPAGMFPSYAVDNDLKYVDEKIRNYYELGEFLTDAEIKEIDEAAKKDDIPIGDGKAKRGRRNAKKEEPAKASAEEKKEEAAKPDAAADEQPAADAGSEAPKKRMRKSREEVQAENAEKIVNAGLEEAGDAEEVPYEEVKDPEVEKLPRRTRKSRNDETAEEQVETPAEEAPARRRRRRG
jgi:adenylate kinase family enzyme